MQPTSNTRAHHRARRSAQPRAIGARPPRDGLAAEPDLRAVRDALRAVAQGDFTVRLPVDDGGVGAEIALAFNAVVTQGEALARELLRVADEVLARGHTAERASLGSAGGGWAIAIAAVNTALEPLAWQTTELTRVLNGLARGDLSRTIPLEIDHRPLQGDLRVLADAANAVTTKLDAVASQVSRVVRQIGTEGKLGVQAATDDFTGTWKGLVDDVDLLSENLTAQLRSIALVTTAVAHGDLSKVISVDARGEIAELKQTINTMVFHLRAFASEVTRVAREVGTEGKLGGQAQVLGAAGTWKDLTDNVNQMATNLTNQVRGIVKVVTAVANGDLSQKFVIEAKGEIAALADTINGMTGTLRMFGEQVTTVAREVGIEGKLGGQAKVPGAAGTWRDLTDNVNMLAGNLTSQVRNIALVTTALANGDLSQKITVDAQGEILTLKNTINATVEQLRTFAREVTRVAHEVGTEGKLGGQAKVPGVAGTWQDLTESVNFMASNLTNQVRGIVKVVTAVATGDLSQKLAVEAKGEIAALTETINGMTDTLRTFADQVTTVAREVGIEGKLGGQARVPGAAGTWRDLTDNVNVLAGNLTSQVRNIALVTTAVANGDLSKKITVGAKGEILELKDTINAMVDQLRTFAAEVTRVAREVGTEGKLGGQAQVPGVAGTWKGLTDNVNQMASNLTDQVRGIVKVVTAVANGDLTKRLTVEANGEIAALADTINNMTDTLRTFAAQVTSVAREVGTEGRLGGQANVPGAAGTWRDLTDNVNQLAANLTTQVRSISDVATAVTQGDLSRTVTVEALGEVLALKDTINRMIANLRETTRTNKEQDWLKTNLARFFAIMQGQRDLVELTRLVISALTPAVGAQHGAFYLLEASHDPPTLKLVSTYAHTWRKGAANTFHLGEGLVGQCALECKPIVVTDVPEDYVAIASGLGQSPARNIAVLPILFENQVRGVIELASFHQLRPVQLTFLEQLMLNIGIAMNLISASMRTQELLKQQQASNVELERRRTDLEEKAALLEQKNREIAETSASLEAKARELAKVSQYKTDFLTNMSHEVRTPLNTMMVLAQMLSEDREERLSPEKQKELASAIHASGHDLFALINQILDLSRIEAGRIETYVAPIAIATVGSALEQAFRPIAQQKRLEFSIDVDEHVPATVTTDRQLLEQILKNLLSNAFKFTEHGRVSLRFSVVSGERACRGDKLSKVAACLAFAVSDTGIGIPPEKQAVVFEAFRQADASITRRYGGTGLGLTLSREYARILGGEIGLESAVGRGATLTLYLPLLAAEAPSPMTRPAPPRPEPATQEPPAGAKVFAGKTVLVVDDNIRNLYATTSLLETHGARVLPVGSAHEAYAALEQHPDTSVVLMDMMMPDVDGLEATRHIRSIPRFAKLPIVALTAKASGTDREQCMAAGCTDYVAKPIGTRHLLAVLRPLLR